VEQTRPPHPLERKIEMSSSSRSRLSTSAAATFLRQRATKLRRPPPVRRRWPDLVDPVSLYLPDPFFFPATGMTMTHPGGEARPGHRRGAWGWGRQGWTWLGYPGRHWRWRIYAGAAPLGRGEHLDLARDARELPPQRAGPSWWHCNCLKGNILFHNHSFLIIFHVVNTILVLLKCMSVAYKHTTT
jgi:hypothetical protein